MSAYFNLEKSFAFYGAYHSDSANKIIHMICVPLIFASSIELLSRISPPWFVLTLLMFYIISFIKMHAVFGILYAPVLALYYWIGTAYLSNYPAQSLILFALAWLAQFIGHGLCEKRAPALLTNLPQSLHSAVFFVWLEVLFALGVAPALHRKLLGAVERERKNRGFKKL